jgi:Fic family protein
MPDIDSLLRSIAAKKAALDALRPLPPAAAAQLRKYYDLDLTYTSNAIEGNTLTARETAERARHHRRRQKPARSSGLKA